MMASADDVVCMMSSASVANGPAPTSKPSSRKRTTPWHSAQTAVANFITKTGVRPIRTAATLIERRWKAAVATAFQGEDGSPIWGGNIIR